MVTSTLPTSLKFSGHGNSITSLVQAVRRRATSHHGGFS